MPPRPFPSFLLRLISYSVLVCRMSGARRPPPWSDLPSELLGLVFLRLPKRADRAFFTAVCRTWCSAARKCRLPPPSPVPWLVVPGGSAISLAHGGGTVQLPDRVRYHVTSGEWLVLSRDDDSCFLMNTPSPRPPYRFPACVLTTPTRSLFKSLKMIWLGRGAFAGDFVAWRRGPCNAERWRDRTSAAGASTAPC